MLRTNLFADRIPVALSAGNQYTCALIDSGGVVCWGRNWEGQLGIGSITSAGSSPASMGAALKTVDLNSELPSNLPSQHSMQARPRFAEAAVGTLEKTALIQAGMA